MLITTLVNSNNNFRYMYRSIEKKAHILYYDDNNIVYNYYPEFKLIIIYDNIIFYIFRDDQSMSEFISFVKQIMQIDVQYIIKLITEIKLSVDDDLIDEISIDNRSKQNRLHIAEQQLDTAYNSWKNPFLIINNNINYKNIIKNIKKIETLFDFIFIIT